MEQGAPPFPPFPHDAARPTSAPAVPASAAAPPVHRHDRSGTPGSSTAASQSCPARLSCSGQRAHPRHALALHQFKASTASCSSSSVAAEQIHSTHQMKPAGEAVGWSRTVYKLTVQCGAAIRAAAEGIAVLTAVCTLHSAHTLSTTKWPGPGQLPCLPRCQLPHPPARPESVRQSEAQHCLPLPLPTHLLTHG
jgi:hypothetical protein